jgi:glycosyltransferase involved in cell wall biosynthesis
MKHNNLQPALRKKVLILIVAYEAEKFIEGVLSRLPNELFEDGLEHYEVLILDDSSQDNISNVVERFAKGYGHVPILFSRNKRNLGYGGNQKIGYRYAIENGFDSVILLHGDGQYPPEMIREMVSPIIYGSADMVLGSRMINKRSALKGRMPKYKWVGNIVLTTIQNKLLGMSLSEFHTGFRSFKVAMLAQVPFEKNSNGFDFDTQIIIQAHLRKAFIEEIAIPTYYGDEISRVNGILYAGQVVKDSAIAFCMKFNILSDARFEIQGVKKYDQLKLGFPSSHEFALSNMNPTSTILDIGGGTGKIAEMIIARGNKCRVVEKFVTKELLDLGIPVVEGDIDHMNFKNAGIIEDTILLLDVIEHSVNPEALMTGLQDSVSDEARIIITTPNIAFLPMRLSLLLGFFNYGEKGILDKDHKRLFTSATLKKILGQSNLKVIKIVGIPAPLELVLGTHWIIRPLHKLNHLLARSIPSLFAYQFGVIARRNLNFAPEIGEVFKFNKKEDF